MGNQEKHEFNWRRISVGTGVLFEGVIDGVVIKIEGEIVVIKLVNGMVERIMDCSLFDITRMVH